MMSIYKAKEAVTAMPATVRLKGFAVGRTVIYNDKHLDDSQLRGHNWGYVGTGPTCLAEDIFKAIEVPADMALFLAPTLAMYILQYLPDNFDILLNLHDLFADVFAEKNPADFYSKHVTLYEMDAPYIVEVSKSSLSPDISITTSVMDEVEDVFIEDDKGRRRKDIPKKVTDLIDELHTVPDSPAE